MYKASGDHPYNISKLTHCVLQSGVSLSIKDKKNLLPILLLFEEFCLQRPLMIRAYHPVAEFSIRKGMEIGIKVTLRKRNCFFFLEKFIDGILPFSSQSGVLEQGV
jgi:large subunit ribosomal protein L5